MCTVAKRAVVNNQIDNQRENSDLASLAKFQTIFFLLSWGLCQIDDLPSLAKFRMLLFVWSWGLCQIDDLLKISSLGLGQFNYPSTFSPNLLDYHLFLGGLSLHLNHLIGSRMANYDWQFGTLPFGLFGSNLDTMDLETYRRTYSGHF